MLKIKKYIPKELIHIILEYDGRIKYRNGEYVNIIHKNDERYNIISPLINKKMEIKKTMEIYENGFYFEFDYQIFTRFSKGKYIPLCGKILNAL
jgi:hypothetical protein